MYKHLNVEALLVPQDNDNHRSAAHRGDYLYRLSQSIAHIDITYTMSMIAHYRAFILFYVKACACNVYKTTRHEMAAVASGLAPRALQAAVVFKMPPPILITEICYFNLLQFYSFHFIGTHVFQK